MARSLQAGRKKPPAGHSGEPGAVDAGQSFQVALLLRQGEHPPAIVVALSGNPVGALLIQQAGR